MNCESLINSLSLKMLASTLHLSPPTSVNCSCCHFRHFRSALQTFLPLRPSSAQILPFLFRRQLAARRRFQMVLMIPIVTCCNIRTAVGRFHSSQRFATCFGSIPVWFTHNPQPSFVVVPRLTFLPSNIPSLRGERF